MNEVIIKWEDLNPAKQQELEKLGVSKLGPIAKLMIVNKENHATQEL